MSEGKHQPAAAAIRTRLAIITGVLLVGGAAVSFLGTRSADLTVKDTDSISQPLPADTQSIKAPADEASRQRLQRHGAQLASQSCLGCHAVDQQVAAPSWHQIVDASKNSQLGTLTELAARIEHPRGNWTSYARGPSRHLVPDDRLALAVWIEQSVRARGEQK